MGVNFRLGGDGELFDVVAIIAGGLAGAVVGPDCLPELASISTINGSELFDGAIYTCLKVMPLAEAKIAFVFGDELKIMLKMPYLCKSVFPSKSAQSA